MPRGWRTAVGAAALSVAAAVGGLLPAVSQAEPPPGGNILATVSYPDGNPTVNVVQFARDAISPFVNVG
jgi:hypothetical protein